MNLPAARSSVGLIAVFCAAQTFAQLGAFTFPALLPEFFGIWSLSHTEAGWLSGIFFGAYSAAVPLLVTLTDRIEARRIYVAAVSLTALSHLGMVFLAEGFVSALIFRILAGVGWAGTYMVGLKALTDHLEGTIQSRGVAAHAASIGVSGSLSFLLAGLVATWFDWHAAFIAAAIGAAGALMVAIVFFPKDARPPARPPGSKLLDFKPVFRNRSAMAYAVGYCVHTWEMFVVRFWAVTFLVFTAAQSGERINLLIPTVVAMLMELVGTVMSVLGNEMAVRIGRQRWILMVMTGSMGVSLVVGFSSAWGYGVATAICLIYNALIYADSASLTAGTVGSAEPGRRGATLAIHAMMGYGGGFVGPLVMGMLLDWLGGESVLNWGLSFAHLALVMLIGPAAFAVLKPRSLSGDRPAP
ncbi:MAG TPA: MFS transporter [Gammaproteobacteria bacterium]|nr:MFS transporter [Gammaproteobacteria bacterium]